MTSTPDTSATGVWRAEHQRLLTQAIDALTRAARLEVPRLQRTAAGEWVEDPTLTGDAMDWAEFVTQALAGAAANLGGVEAILEGRSGSWEAAGVRQLLHSTVGPDETDLWRHRTDPVAVTLYVDEIVSDCTNSDAQYDDA